jgi:hypothetical protein
MFAGLASLGCGSSKSDVNGEAGDGGNVCGDFCTALKTAGHCSAIDMPTCEADCAETRQARSPCLSEDKRLWECSVPFAHCIEFGRTEPPGPVSSLAFDDWFLHQSCQEQIAALDSCLSASGKKLIDGRISQTHKAQEAMPGESVRLIQGALHDQGFAPGGIRPGPNLAFALVAARRYE